MQNSLGGERRWATVQVLAMENCKKKFVGGGYAPARRRRYQVAATREREDPGKSAFLNVLPLIFQIVMHRHRSRALVSDRGIIGIASGNGQRERAYDRQHCSSSPRKVALYSRKDKEVFRPACLHTADF